MARLGWESEDHNSEIDNLLEDLARTLERIGDETDCRGRYWNILVARGTLGEIGGHIEASEGIGGGEADERRAAEYERLNEWLGKIMHSFGERCVRGV